MSDPESNDSGLQRVAVGVEYDGSTFSGWQRQRSPELPTVQGVVEKALSRIADHPLSLICAGRTDRGVHATRQVVHFDSLAARDEKAWVVGGNSLLPPTVRILWARRVDHRFHARFSATVRRYCYVIHDSPVAPAVLSALVTHHYKALDIEAMHAASQCLVGEQDFSTFRAAGCQSKTAMRHVHTVSVRRLKRFIVLDIEANAFLQHMVRNIAGMLIAIGEGELPVSCAAELLHARDRTLAPATAPAAGLYLVDVAYAPEFGLPPGPTLPLFLQ
ncbi:MAG: tRNA pseudouridine(38-40) synthase TruA [Pseudohongiellaceae bacterium]